MHALPVSPENEAENFSKNVNFNQKDKKIKIALTVYQEPLPKYIHSHQNAYLKPELRMPLNRKEITAYISDPSSGSVLKYDQLGDRLKTFTLPPPWEGPVDPHSMSEAGFVYTGQEDLVYCFSCNIKLDGWTKHMDPLLRHKEESPTCSFVRQQLQVIKGEKGKNKLVVVHSKPLNPRLTKSISQLRASTSFDGKSVHTVVTGLDESRLYVTSRGTDDYSRLHLPITVEKYGLEEERLKSFVGWPLNEAVHPEQLARVGFVYTGEGSLVQCFQCGVRYRNWLKNDIPLSIHQRCNPHCTFLHAIKSKTKSSLEEQSVSTQNENTVLEFPDYSGQATRLQSFKYWGGVLPKEELAEAGFYMIARRDVVRCFSCCVVLQDWEKTDNVIDEHRKHSPECGFLKVFPVHSINVPHCSSIDNTSLVTVSSAKESVALQNGLNSTQVHLGKTKPTAIKKANSALLQSPEEPLGLLKPPSWRSNPPLPLHNILNSNSDKNIVCTESHGELNIIICYDDTCFKYQTDSGKLP